MPNNTQLYFDFFNKVSLPWTPYKVLPAEDIPLLANLGKVGLALYLPDGKIAFQRYGDTSLIIYDREGHQLSGQRPPS